MKKQHVYSGEDGMGIKICFVGGADASESINPLTCYLLNDEIIRSANQGSTSGNMHTGNACSRNKCCCHVLRPNKWKS